MLVPAKFPLPVIGKILETTDIRRVDLPEAANGLYEVTVVAYPYYKTYEEARLDPWVVLHSSASTGMPNLIIQPHAIYLPVDAYTLCRRLASLELFHGSQQAVAYISDSHCFMVALRFYRARYLQTIQPSWARSHRHRR